MDLARLEAALGEVGELDAETRRAVRLRVEAKLREEAAADAAGRAAREAEAQARAEAERVRALDGVEARRTPEERLRRDEIAFEVARLARTNGAKMPSWVRENPDFAAEEGERERLRAEAFRLEIVRRYPGVGGGAA